MVKYTKKQIKDFELIHFHLVDLKNTMESPGYTKEVCIDVLQHIIGYIKGIIDLQQ